MKAHDQIDIERGLLEGCVMESEPRASTFGTSTGEGQFAFLVSENCPHNGVRVWHACTASTFLLRSWLRLPLIRIRTRRPLCSFALLTSLVSMPVAMLMLMLMPSPSSHATSRYLRPTQIRFTATATVVVARTRIRITVPSLTRLVVDTAYLRALLAHSFVVDDVFGPLDASMALIGRGGTETKGVGWDAGSCFVGVGLEDGLAAVRGSCGRCYA